MSYALMKHPSGLLCQIFISHAWAEGIFELGDHVRRAWPRMHRLHNLYCCLLANPQNLDMSTWLDGPPAETPFARAMQSASHVLIIPNSTVGIYTRLWCVYEAYLGTQYKKTCIMPARPKTTAQCRILFLTVLLPIVIGLVSGLALVLIPLEDLHLKMMADGLFLMAFLTTILCFGISPTFKLFKGKCPHRCIHQNMNILRAIHVVLMCILTLVAFPWTMLPGPHFTPSNFDHYFILFGTWLFNILRVTQLNEELLEDRELERQATNLDFTSLADATCSDQRDEVRIREAIAGFESEVEIAILILMKAGAYDDSLRRAYEDGANITGLGTTDLVVKTSVATLLWLLCAAHCFAVFVLQDSDVCFQHGGQSVLVQGQVSVTICTSVALFVPVTAFLMERRGPEQGVFGIRVWIISATYALGIPAVFEVTEFLIEQQIWFLQLPFVDKYCPSGPVVFLLIWFPVIMAICALALLMLGQNLWLSWNFRGATMEKVSSSPDSDSNESSTS
ncbi:unnamed protein product [Cladocopium goreaui]|uniref:Uncharacterized protein n=1 Tax=Cladocopium goreaui TaxID=2562237 RepID=A0A9P1FID8_9DINO|nr:unnamed protein product [Cladocopium goreaui]